MWAEGKGALQSSSDARMAWLAGVLRAAASYPADGALGVRLALDGQLNVVRPELKVAPVPAAPPAPQVEGVESAAGIKSSFALKQVRYKTALPLPT